MNLRTDTILLVLLGCFLFFRIYTKIKMKQQVPQLLKKGAVVVDVRTPAEFAVNCNPNSVNYPLNELNQHIENLDKNKIYILCCASGVRSSVAARIFKKSEFQNVINAGSWQNTLV